MTSTWEIVRRGRATAYVERADGPVLRRELPGPGIAVILELGPPLRTGGTRFAGGFVAGLSDSPTDTEHDGFQAGVQIDLAPVEARALFGVPMSELAGRCVALADLLPRRLRSLPARLADLRDPAARLALAERALAVTPRATVHESVARWACARLTRAGGAVDVRALARELGYSEKQVARIFRDFVGVTPKRFARLIRFRRLVERLHADPHAGWARLAADGGFYDQAHLVRDVRQFAGMTPTELRVVSFQDPPPGPMPG